MRGRIRLQWRFIGTCILFEGVTGTEELYEILRKNDFQSLFVSQSEAWEALQRMDTSLLRAACWTMASGMKLEKHVKALSGDDCKVDWCCEILSESGVPCGVRFRSKKALRSHQLRSRSHGHGLQTSIFVSVITNSCPWCRSTFATTLIARKHAVAAMLSGHPSDDILDSLYKLRTRESAQLKTALEVYDMEIHQNISMPYYQKLKTMVKRSIDQKLRLRNFDDRHGRIE